MTHLPPSRISRFQVLLSPHWFVFLWRRFWGMGSRTWAIALPLTLLLVAPSTPVLAVEEGATIEEGDRPTPTPFPTPSDPQAAQPLYFNYLPPLAQIATDIELPPLSTPSETVVSETVVSETEFALSEAAPIEFTLAESDATGSDATESEPLERDPLESDVSGENRNPEAMEADASDLAPRYGDRGQHRWYLQGGLGTNLDGSDPGSFGLVGAGLSHFFANGQSLNLELNGLGFIQEGEDAVGLNLALLHRWDFIRRPDWSLYIDGGVGVIGTTSPVPSEGSSLAFTPQAGGGATIRLANDQRLMLGLRWHHISNGNLFEDNPGQDSIYGYLGINFPR